MQAEQLELISPELRQWARASIERIRRVQGPGAAPQSSRNSSRKMLIVHLDGVPRALLDEAIASGKMPFFASLVRSGEYSLDSAFWGSPASTPCFQAGLLYGARHPNLPAYNWFDRELGRNVRMNAPKDALEIEKRLGRVAGNSLLSGGGTSYLSLFRADAENRLCMTSLAEWKVAAQHLRRDLRGLRGPKRQGVFSYLRGLVGDMWTAGMDVFRWTRSLDNDFRHEKEYLLNRFFMIQLAWGLAETRALNRHGEGRSGRLPRVRQLRRGGTPPRPPLSPGRGGAVQGRCAARGDLCDARARSRSPTTSTPHRPRTRGRASPSSSAVGSV